MPVLSAEVKVKRGEQCTQTMSFILLNICWARLQQYQRKAFRTGNARPGCRLIRIHLEELRLCTCAVAEVLYQAGKAKSEQQESGLAGPLASWSNDGQSGTVDLSNSTLTETGKMKEVRRLIAQYLCNTGLMYRGLK